MYDYGGGGGWGDPLDRDPQAVLDDVLDEYVSVEGASRDYGVVLTGSLEDLTLAIDDVGDRTRSARADASRNEPDMGFRVGVDVGGTFTDLICVTPAGEVVLDKTPDHARRPVDRRDERARAARRALRHRRSTRSAATSTSSCTAPPPPTTR